MLSILNFVYREFLRASLSGAKVASVILLQDGDPI